MIKKMTSQFQGWSLGVAKEVFGMRQECSVIGAEGLGREEKRDISLRTCMSIAQWGAGSWYLPC